MRYLCFVKMDESEDLNPPVALMEAMDEHVGQGFASGMLLDAGGLYGVKEAVEFRVRGGSLTVTDGPYAEAKEVIGGWAIIKVDTRGGGSGRGPEDGRPPPRALAHVGGLDRDPPDRGARGGSHRLLTRWAVPPSLLV